MFLSENIWYCKRFFFLSAIGDDRGTTKCQQS